MASYEPAERLGSLGGGVPQAILAAVVDASDDAIFTFDAYARINSWSPSASRLFGRDESESLGQTFDTLFPEHLGPEVLAIIERALAGDHIRRYETELVRADELPVQVSLSISPIIGVAGEPVAAVVIVRDVTEQVLAQATLAEVENRLRDSEALAHIGSWLWDVRTGVVQWSAEFHRIHGVDPLEFDGTLESYLVAIHPDDRGRMRRAMEAAVVSGRSFEEEYRVTPVGSPSRIVRVRAEATIGSSGLGVGLRGVGQDVTDERSADND